MARVWISKHAAGRTDKVLESLVYDAIPNFPQIKVQLGQKKKLLVTLNVPDTWNAKEGSRNEFGIAFGKDPDDMKVERRIGTFWAPKDNARVPVTVQAVLECDEGTHYLQAVWKTKNGVLYIGADFDSTLTALACNAD